MEGMDVPAKPQQVKKIPIKKEIKDLFEEAAEERRNAMSSLALMLFKKHVELAFHATSDTARRADMRIASDFFTQVIRAEKNEDTETLMELERKLAELSDGSDVEDL